VLLNLVTTANFGMSIRFYGDGNTLKEGELNNVATKDQEISIEAAMGTQTRNTLFANLYLMRYDTVETVGSMAWRVWHLVVPNEKDLLQIVLPTLMESCRSCLSSESKDRRETGRKTVGGLVTSTGQEGLHYIIPILQKQLTSEDGDTRKAACLGFSEVLKSADRAHIGAFLNDIIPLIRDMLCDSVHQVRVGAGHAFRQLYKNVGSKAIDKIAPYLIDSMKGEKADEAVVNGLVLVLEACARNTFFYLVATILNTLKDIENDANDLLRKHIVDMLSPMVNDVTDVMTIRGSKALHRFCEESYSLAEFYLPLFCPAMIRRNEPYLREPVKQAIYQCLIHAFRFHEDKEKGKKALLDFINTPHAGYVVQGQPGIISVEDTEELIATLAAIVPETQVTDLAQMNLPDETPAEEETAGSDAAAGGAPAEEEVKVAVGPGEKQCSKCKKVKPKNKFSGKMQKKSKGVCKVCS